VSNGMYIVIKSDITTNDDLRCSFVALFTSGSANRHQSATGCGFDINRHSVQDWMPCVWHSLK